MRGNRIRIVTIQVSDRYGQTTTAAAFVTVGDVMVYQAANLSIYGFTSSQPGAQASNFSASINWGDGVDAAHPDITGGQIVSAGNVFGVTGGHTYLSAGTFPITVTVTDSWGNSITTGGGVLVGETLSGVGQSITKLEGSLGTFVLGSVFTGDVTASAGAFQAFIDWGDGTGFDASGYFLANKAGGYDLIGVHTYINAGLYHIVATMLLAGAAVTTDADAVVAPNWADASKYALKLDVNANGILDENLDGGVPDGVANYLPGYEGTTAKLAQDNKAAYNKVVFQAQQMRLYLDGVGQQALQGLNGATLLFQFAWDDPGELPPSKIYRVTHIPGYAGNATDASITGAGRDADFSFNKSADQMTAKPPSGNGAGDVTIENGRSWAPLWCKDYGGWGTVWADVLNAKGAFLYRFELTLPVDKNNDHIADVWEVAKAKEYDALDVQTWPRHPPSDPMKFLMEYGDWVDLDSPPSPWNITAKNDPLLIPPGRGHDAKQQLITDEHTFGDGLYPDYEYRGVLVDGGGFSPDGQTMQQGHVRLTPAIKEVLIDVDEMATEASNPVSAPQNVADWMKVVTASYSQQKYGAGMNGYFVFHSKTAQDRAFEGYFGGRAYKSQTEMQSDMQVYINKLRQPVLGVPVHQYWRHLTIAATLGAEDKIQSFLAHKPVLSGYTGFSSIAVDDYSERCGSFFYVTEVTGNKALNQEGGYDFLAKKISDAKKAGALDKNAILTFDALAEGTIAHELAHQFSRNEGHYNDSDGDGYPDIPPGKNGPGDYGTVQYDYEKPGPGYLWQDYWTGINYGHGYAIATRDGTPQDGQGFLQSIDLDWTSTLDNPY